MCMNAREQASTGQSESQREEWVSHQWTSKVPATRRRTQALGRWQGGTERQDTPKERHGTETRSTVLLPRVRGSVTPAWSSAVISFVYLNGGRAEWVGLAH